MRKLLLLTMPLLLLFAAAGPAPKAAAAGPVAAPPATVHYPSSVGDVSFPHDRHLKVGCPQCHHQIKAMPLDTPHPGYMDSSWIHCQTCHSEAAASGGAFYKCADCHHSEPADIADETLSAKVVTHKSCWQCHQSGTGAEASEGCSFCHQKQAAD